MSAKPDFFLAFLAGLAIGLAHVFLYGFFCNSVKKYLGRAADFTESSDEAGPWGGTESGREMGSANFTESSMSGTGDTASHCFADEKSFADASNTEDEQKSNEKNRDNQGIRFFQRIASFTALCRIAVTAFLAWLAICACSLPAIPVVVGFALVSGTGIIKLARTSAKDR